METKLDIRQLSLEQLITQIADLGEKGITVIEIDCDAQPEIGMWSQPIADDFAHTFEDETQALVYGEVEFDPFVKILKRAIKGLRNYNKFVDLGSGCGRAVIITALIIDYSIVMVFLSYWNSIKVLKYDFIISVVL